MDYVIDVTNQQIGAWGLGMAGDVLEHVILSPLLIPALIFSGIAIVAFVQTGETHRLPSPQVQKEFVEIEPPGWDFLKRVREKNRSMDSSSITPNGDFSMRCRFHEAPIFAVLEHIYWNRSIYQFRVKRIEGFIRIPKLAIFTEEHIKIFPEFIVPRISLDSLFRYFWRLKLLSQK